MTSMITYCSYFFQRINHFPGMGEICRKDCLSRNMTKMIKCQPHEYSFIPRTWIFPAEYTQYQNYVKELKKKRKQKTFIIKPANGAMGHGISLIRNGEKLQAQDHLIVQEYLDKPFLLEGYKFDLRIYILVTSCDPLRIFLYNDGLVRMGTEKYHPPSESNLVSFMRIYPPEDKLLLEKYEGLLSTAFQTFLAGRAASLQREMNNPLKRMKEEDILDLLEQCELDDEKLSGKSTRQREPRTLSSMPECTQTSKKKSYSSSNSSSTGGDSSSDSEEEKLVKEKKVSYDLDEQKLKSLERSSRIHCKPPTKSRPFTFSSPSSSSTPIRRSVSCPRSITALNAQTPHTEQQRPLSSKVSAQVSRPTSGNRTNSLNRSTSSHRVPHTGTCSSMYPTLNETGLHHLSKDQEEELTKQTLHVLQNMRIRFPGKMDEDETCAIIDEIIDNWRYHKPKLASYWLIKLDSVKQRKILDIVRTNIRSVLQRIWKVSDVECLHLYRSFNRVFNRLLWSHGQGLWSCFCDSSTSWETIFSKSTEVVTPDQLQCCHRLVQLCKNCLLVVYKYATDSRGSAAGVSPDGSDTRYLLPVVPQFSIKMSSSSLGPTGLPRSNFLFTSRLTQY
ncbi:hypothetical protein GDO81_017654 [Engystomops pustulosus]|uniref:Tubulin polyglutamylase TTLL7 n=1 Tax=Engystomops pustulosus TaxID=76066 RepID=A0AAV7A101_ENGPU|nr:hypothetical protein GDO81_017654 [Engystomops pustulosus]